MWEPCKTDSARESGTKLVYMYLHIHPKLSRINIEYLSLHCILTMNTYNIISLFVLLTASYIL